MMMMMRFQLFVITLFSIIIVQCFGDICELCECNELDATESIIIAVECHDPIKNNVTIELDNIQWPSDGNSSISGSFNNLRISFVPKVLGSFAVRSLNLDNNIIDSFTNDPFQHCKNIEFISLANNSIKSLPKDLFKSTKYLRELNLAANSLDAVNQEAVIHLTQLHTLDVSYNRLATLSDEIMSMETIRILNLKGNRIFVIESMELNSNPSAVVDLNLAENKFTMIASTTFEHFPKLENLNLAFNEITNIENEAFTKLGSLTQLNLSNNKIIDLSLQLPNSLEHLSMAFNRLHKWPISHLPQSLYRLDIQHNLLTELFPQSAFNPQSNLHILNASHNEIDTFSSGSHFMHLTVLDLSYNQFAHIPVALPILLDTLILDHNPIERIRFANPIQIRHLSIRHMPILMEIDGMDFEMLVTNEHCIDLIISHCPHLSQINANALNNIDICKLDLSYNAFVSIPFNLTDWTDIRDGIDLQGNPLHCNCSGQWMLDIVLRELYQNLNHQHYLANLRCASPKPFTGHRLVKYYKKIDAFCNPNAAMRLSSYVRAQENDGDLEIFRGHVSIPLIIVAGCAIVLIILIVIGIYLTRVQTRKMAKKNRRYPLY